MTYEQGGGPRGGRSIRLDNNEVMTLADRVNHHHTTSMATIEVASLNADKLCSNFSAYYEQAVKNPQGPYKTYIIKQTNAPNKIKELCKLLDAHKIKYGSLKSGASVNGFDYIQTKEAVYEAKTGDLVISAYQPMSVLTQILFDPENVINDSLTYDITAWGLPYAFGLDAIATKQKIIARIAKNCVVTHACVNDIVTVPAAQTVVALHARDLVQPKAARHRIIAKATIHEIMAAIARQLIATAAAEERVDILTARDRVVENST